MIKSNLKNGNDKKTVTSQWLKTADICYGQDNVALSQLDFAGHPVSYN